MKTIELTEDQLKNLMVFLNRVQLVGGEVSAYVELVAVINKSAEPKPKDKKI